MRSRLEWLRRRLPRRSASAAWGSTARSRAPREHSIGELPVKGQGTIALGCAALAPFRIVVHPGRAPGGSLRQLVLDVGERFTCFRDRDDTSSASVIAGTTAAAALLEPGKPRTYWLSIDRQRRRLRFGKGQLLEQLVVFECQLPEPRSAGGDPYAFVRELCDVELLGVPHDARLDVWPLPVTASPPPSLIRPEHLTLEDVARNAHTVPSELPEACRALYGTIGGASMTLDTPDFPDFSRAIEHSIMTPGCFCHEALKAKAAGSASRDPRETYLRITLGHERGDSPGAPYVLELWPGGHYSPVHDHGGACAMIRVLHGDISVELYAELDASAPEYFAKRVFHTGDVTFMTPHLYHVHRLRNENPPGCMTATLQCYRYEKDDTQHRECFDYIGHDGEIHAFAPGSDSDFLEFKALIRREWAGPR